MSAFCKRRFLAFLLKHEGCVKVSLIRTKSTHLVGHPQYCLNVVRKSDYENYLACLLLPKSARAAAFAIGAFNVEVSQVQDVVSEKQIGLMRLQFWKDTIDKIFEDNPPETPIAQELARAHKEHNLSKQWFKRMLAAREDGMNRTIFKTMSEIEEYSEKAFSSPLYLILESLGIRDVQADHAASHVGNALGITLILRSVPYHARRRCTYLPMDVMMKHGISQEDIYRCCNQQELEQNIKDVLFDVACAAQQQLTVARQLKSSVPKNTHLALLPVASCAMYLNTLKNLDFNVFCQKIQSRNPWLPMALLTMKFRKNF